MRSSILYTNVRLARKRMMVGTKDQGKEGKDHRKYQGKELKDQGKEGKD